MANVIIAITIFLIGIASSQLLPKPSDQVLLKLLFKYKNYDIILHYDNRSQFLFDISSDASSMAFQFVNYDILNGRVNLAPTRKAAHIILLQNEWNFQKFSSLNNRGHENNLDIQDSVIFVMARNISDKDELLASICTIRGIEKAGSVIVYDSVDAKYSYVNTFFGEMKELFEGIPLHNSFSNFRNHRFTVGYYPHTPHVLCSSRDSLGHCKITGTEGKVLTTLSEHLNFSYELVDFSNKNLAFKAMIQSVHNKSLDFAFGDISHTFDRSLLVDYTSIVNFEPYGAVYSSNMQEYLKLKTFILPIDRYVWIFFFSSFVLVATAFKFISKFRFESAVDHQDYNLFLFRAIMKQCSTGRTLSSSNRILVIIWWIYAIVLTTAYESKLASFVIKPKIIEPNSAAELLSLDYNFLTPLVDSVFIRENMMINGSVYKRIEERLRDALLCPGFVAALGNKVALIVETSAAEVLLWESCAELMSLDEINTLRFTRDYIFTTMIAWPVQQGAPYREVFSKVIQRLQSTGHLERWYSIAPKQKIPKSNQRPLGNTFEPMKIATIVSHLFILFLGHLVGTAIFLIEIAHFKYSCR